MTNMIIILSLVTSMQIIFNNGQSIQFFLTFGKENAILQRHKEQMAAGKAPDHSHPVASRVFRFLKSTPYIKSMGYNVFEQLTLIQEYGKRNGISGASLLNQIKSKSPKGSLFKPCSSKDYFSDQPLPMPRKFSCCPLPVVKCNPSEYRTIDGSCNCKSNSDMGRSNRAMRRVLQPDYGDGIDSPRLAKNGANLPSARTVSNDIHPSSPGRVSGVLTLMHMSVGQVIDHDSDRTPISKLMKADGETLVDVQCGVDGCQTSGDENRECFPIEVPQGDPAHKSDCLIFVRSQAYFRDKCEIGPREQANALTSWLDASHVYGSNIEELNRIRDSSNAGRGRMRTSVHPLNPRCKPLLPTSIDESCRGVTDKIKCFVAGDERVNEQIGLTSMHTVFVRLHNYFEDQLYRVLPKGNGEILFQETRKLVIAVWQSIIYREYLPLTVGPRNMDKYGLSLQKHGDCFKGHDCTRFSGDVPNVFAAAAYRYGHSQVGDFMWLSNPQFTKKKPVPFSSVMFNPKLIYSPDLPNNDDTCGVSAILLGLCSNQAQQVDYLFSHQLTRHLFSENPPHGVGSDLAALNIQRGRDHGIPGYTKWREFCGLSVPTSFDEMTDIPGEVRAEIQQVYDHVDDVDLYPAAIAERLVEGGAVGPTFACIIAHHFQSVKYADNFWFERCDSKGGFSKEQMDTIRQYSLGRFLCDTLDNIDTIQKFPMMVSLKQAAQNLGLSETEIKRIFPLYTESNNERIKCSDLRGMDFSLWDSLSDGGGQNPLGPSWEKGPTQPKTRSRKKKNKKKKRT